MPRIPTNLPKSPKRVFVLATPGHMFMKLHWELKALKKLLDPSTDHLRFGSDAAYVAFNFAITAWHLTDWVWSSFEETQKVDLFLQLKLESKTLRGFQDHMRSRSRELNICSELANGSKHMEDHPSSSIETSFKVDKSQALVGQFRVGEPLVKYAYEMVVTDKQGEIKVTELFDYVYLFWREYLIDHGFITEIFITSDLE